MPREIIWVIGGEKVDLGKLACNRKKLSALEEALSVVHGYLPELVVARSQLPYGEMAYSNEPTHNSGATVLKFPCGHEYFFGDRGAFTRPMCEVCDAELAKKVKEQSGRWFSRKVVKPAPTALATLKGALSTTKVEIVTDKKDTR